MNDDATNAMDAMMTMTFQIFSCFRKKFILFGYFNSLSPNFKYIVFFKRYFFGGIGKNYIIDTDRILSNKSSCFRIARSKLQF